MKHMYDYNNEGFLFGGRKKKEIPHGEQNWEDKEPPEAPEIDFEDYNKEYFSNCPYKIIGADSDDESGQDIYEIRKEGSDIYFLLINFEWRDYAILKVFREKTPEEYEPEEGDVGYEIIRKIKMEDTQNELGLEIGFKWIAKNYNKILSRYTETVPDIAPKDFLYREPEYTERYKKTPNLGSKVNLNAPDESTFDNYNVKKFSEYVNENLTNYNFPVAIGFAIIRPFKRALYDLANDYNVNISFNLTRRGIKAEYVINVIGEPENIQEFVEATKKGIEDFSSRRGGGGEELEDNIGGEEGWSMGNHYRRHRVIGGESGMEYGGEEGYHYKN